jgi:hypothetical protein
VLLELTTIIAALGISARSPLFRRCSPAVIPPLSRCYPAVICGPFPAKRYANQIVTGTTRQKTRGISAAFAALGPSALARKRGFPRISGEVCCRFRAEAAKSAARSAQLGCSDLELDHLMV